MHKSYSEKIQVCFEELRMIFLPLEKNHHVVFRNLSWNLMNFWIFERLHKPKYAKIILEKMVISFEKRISDLWKIITTSYSEIQRETQWFLKIQKIIHTEIYKNNSENVQVSFEAFRMILKKKPLKRIAVNFKDFSWMNFINSFLKIKVQLSGVALKGEKGYFSHNK